MSKRPTLGTSGKLALAGKRKLARQLLDREQRECDRRGLLSLVAGRRPDYRATDGVTVVVETGVPTYRPRQTRQCLSAGGGGAMAGDGVACLRCCGIPNGVARHNEALRTNNGYNATINLVTRDDGTDKTAKARAAAGQR